MALQWPQPWLLLFLLSHAPFACVGQGPPAVIEQEPPAAASLGEGGEAPSEPPRAGDPMSELLNWAVRHSDPETLKELMRKYQENNLTLKDVYGDDFLDAMFVDEGSEMLALTAQIRDFRNKSIDDESLEMAMERLQEFVEQIDNAANLHKMGGLAPLLDLGLYAERSSATRAVALWTLGIAMQNNPPVQEDVMGMDGLTRLSSELPRCGAASGAAVADAQYCGKLVFTFSALVKNSDSIQGAASSAGVFDWMLDEGAAHPALPVAKKCMGLVDTVLAQNPELPFLKALTGPRQGLAQALLAHLRGDTAKGEFDLDATEKSLRLVGRLLGLRPLLFPSSFQKDLASAASAAIKGCEGNYGVGDELCVNLKGLAGSADLMLTARDVADDEL